MDTVNEIQFFNLAMFIGEKVRQTQSKTIPNGL